jgi:hypothetical protein
VEDKLIENAVVFRRNNCVRYSDIVRYSDVKEDVIGLSTVLLEAGMEVVTRSFGRRQARAIV